MEKKVGLAINRYSLVAGDDSVAVGLSGGKDSFVLLETLARRRRRLPVTYGIHAVHVHIPGIGYEADLKYMRQFCAELSVPFKSITIDADLDHSPEKSRCFVCSWHRRKALFDYCTDNNCGILALGHHMDDAVETFIMNMVFSGTMSSMPPLLSMFKGRLKLVRPLLLLSESEIEQYARMKKFPPMLKDCPYSCESKRDSAKRMLAMMKEMDPAAVKNIFRSMSNIHSEYLPHEGDQSGSL